MHVHARAGAAHLTQCMLRKHTCMLRGHFWPRQLLFVFFLTAFIPSFLASQNGGGKRKKWQPVHVPAVSPRELTGTTALKRGIPPGARGGFQILGMVSVLTAVVDVAAFSSAEKQKLVALVQSRQARDVDDSELSAPAAAVYVSHSSDTVDVLNDLLDKAQTLLDVARHAESNAAHNFALLKQSLDQLTQDIKALTKAKVDNSEFASSLEAERADLAEAEKSLGGC